MTGLREDLFGLLPRIHRERDAETGQDHALEALLRVLGEQADVLAADLARMYDDAFVETCADWLVPYLGELLGVRLLHPVGPGAGRPRALVADTLDHRRRKGTLAGLEDLAFQVTGWPTAAVEYFRRLGTTQHLAHPRPDNLRTPDLRRGGGLPGPAGSPFAPTAHTAEVRRLPHGRHGISNVGLHVWRLVPQRIVRATARPVADPPDGRYLVDPTGLPVPLFNPGTAEPGGASLAREHHVPAPLRTRALYDELEALRAGTRDEPRWFGDDPVVEVFADLGAGLEAVPAEQLTAADLADRAPAPAPGWPRPADPVLVAVDPVLGRLAFRAGVVPSAVEVTATYATPGAVGAGGHDRACPETAGLLARHGWFRAVGALATPVPGVVCRTLAEAVDDWNATAPGTVGVVVVLDSRTYAGDLDLVVPAGSDLLVLAAGWPDAEDVDATTLLDPADARPDDRRPHLLGSLAVAGTPGPDDAPPGQLTLDGLLVEGDVTVRAGDLGRLVLRHVTVVPGAGVVAVDPPVSADDDNGHLTVEISRSVTGRVTLPARGPALEVARSIVDGLGAGAVDAAHAPVDLDRVTVVGALAALELSASDCVLTGPVTVTRRQSGCVRFSHLAEGAVAPRRYRCQPDLALTDVRDPARAAAVRARLFPVLSSTTYGDPGYGRLDDRADPALLAGASDGSAMGAFAELREPQRHANLVAVLEEYLRLGLDAGVIHET